MSTHHSSCWGTGVGKTDTANQLRFVPSPSHSSPSRSRSLSLPLPPPSAGLSLSLAPYSPLPLLVMDAVGL
jgi:hypothetical protein